VKLLQNATSTATDVHRWFAAAAAVLLLLLLPVRGVTLGDA
jgi:hypothetical protein